MSDRLAQSCTETLTQDSSPIGRYTNCFHATSKTPFALTYRYYNIYLTAKFISMQSDAYQATGCYNLLCSGFIQTNNRIAIGAAISPVSSYKGGQFDISLLIWKVLFSPSIYLNYFSTIIYVGNIDITLFHI